MAIITRQLPDPHLVFVDTSTLWFDDKQYVVDPTFDEFWEEYSGSFGLELIIPEVVKGEVLFQQTITTLKALKRANDAMRDVERVTKKSYSHRVTEKRVRREIEQKFEQWERARQVSILPTPADTIPWRDIIDQAIWRTPPFSPDKSEKGFRDALILETIIQHCAQESRMHPMAFLCKDRLLRETVEKRMANDDRFTGYEFISDLRSYLDLTKEKLEVAFIKSIIRRARKKFFTLGDPNCLYYRENIRSTLRETYQKYFDNPEESEPSLSILGAPLLQQGLSLWEPVSRGKFWISKPQFVSVANENEYTWLNIITFVRQYRRQQELVGLLRGTEVLERILILPYHITWRAKVTSNGRFRSYEYVSAELKDNVFRAPTEEDLKEWRLDASSATVDE